MELRNLKEKDANKMFEWMTDPEMYCNFQFDPEKVSLEGCKEFIKSTLNDETNKHFAIVDEEDVYCGTISIKNINDKNGEYAISVMKEYHGLGIAEFATKKILDISFNELNLNKVYLNVLSENKRAIKFYEKMGFNYEGEFKEHIYKDGEYKDLKWFAIFKNPERR